MTKKFSSIIILTYAVFRYYIQPPFATKEEMRILVFWDVTLCSRVNGYEHSFNASGSANPSIQRNINTVKTSKHTTEMFLMATKEYLLKALKIVGESFITRLIDAILSLHATLPIAIFTLFKTSSTLLSTLIINFLL